MSKSYDYASKQAPWSPTRKRVFRFGNQAFFARQGAILMVDERTGELEAISRHDLYDRARALSLGINRVPHQLALQLYNLAGDAQSVGREARMQGDPFSRHRPMMVQKPARIVVPGGGVSVNAPAPISHPSCTVPAAGRTA